MRLFFLVLPVFLAAGTASAAVERRDWFFPVAAKADWSRQIYGDQSGKRIAVPVLTIYRADGTPVHHQKGVNLLFPKARLRGALKDERAVEGVASLDFVFDHLVTEAGRAIDRADIPEAEVYIVQYHAPWCGFCKKLRQQVLDVTDGAEAGRFAFISVDVNFNQREAP